MSLPFISSGISFAFVSCAFSWFQSSSSFLGLCRYPVLLGVFCTLTYTQKVFIVFSTKGKKNTPLLSSITVNILSLWIQCHTARATDLISKELWTECVTLKLGIWERQTQHVLFSFYLLLPNYMISYFSNQHTYSFSLPKHHFWISLLFSRSLDIIPYTVYISVHIFMPMCMF